MVKDWERKRFMAFGLKWQDIPRAFSLQGRNNEYYWRTIVTQFLKYFLQPVLQPDCSI